MPELCLNAICFASLGLALSEKQVPQVDVNTREATGLSEPLEPGFVRPRQARYQAALRPDMKCNNNSKAGTRTPPNRKWFSA